MSGNASITAAVKLLTSAMSSSAPLKLPGHQVMVMASFLGATSVDPTERGYRPIGAGQAQQ